MARIIKFEFKKVFGRFEFWITLLLGSIFAFVALIERTVDTKFLTTNTVYSPEFASLMGFSGVKNLVFCLLPLLATIPCACFYFEECQNHAVSIQVIRARRKNYFSGKGVVISIVGFFCSVFPFVLNLIFTTYAYPFPTDGIFSENVYIGSKIELVKQMLFPSIYTNHPMFYATIIIVFIGIYGAGMALLSYAITLFYQKHIIVAISATTVLNVASIIILSALKLNHFTIIGFFTADYLYPNNHLALLVSELFILFAIDIFLIATKIYKDRDVLV
jgi:hypothetical protein